MPFRILAKQAQYTAFLNMTVIPVTTAAWVQIVASLPYACTAMEIFNPSAATMKISKGAAGQETTGNNLIPYSILPGGSSILLPINLPSLSRISLEAVDQTASSGYFILNFFG